MDRGVVSGSLTIGEFAKLTHLSVKALRHYHDIGLLVCTIAAFPRNTLCEGTFELLAASYVMFCTLVGADGTSHFAQGVAATFVVA